MFPSERPVSIHERVAVVLVGTRAAQKLHTNLLVRQSILGVRHSTNAWPSADCNFAVKQGLLRVSHLIQNLPERTVRHGISRPDVCCFPGVMRGQVVLALGIVDTRKIEVTLEVMVVNCHDLTQES